MAKLEHPHIVRVLDTEHCYGTHFIVMEKLRGQVLADAMLEGAARRWDVIRTLLMQVAQALDYAHRRGLVHRDVKPGNVFLTDDGDAKLLDFGIAARIERSATGKRRVGTPYYMPPEQILGKALDGRSDLYALGVTAYQMITGKGPFDAENVNDLLQLHLHEPMPDPRSVVAGVPEDLAQFIEVATQKSPEDRFDSCDDAAQFLQIAAELPQVNVMALSTVAISYHPARGELVEEALADLHKRLDDVVGISVVSAHQRGESPGDEE